MSDYVYEMALTMLPGMGSNSARQLLELVDSAEALFAMSRSDLQHLFEKHTAIVDAILSRSMMPEVESELAFCQKHNIRVLFMHDHAYPQRLNRSECSDAPILLYYMGDADLNAERMVSVVGTRKCTEYGRELTRKLVEGFVGEGITVVSGLAYGIDAAAHEASVNNSLPTVGVLAHGLDQIYPSQHKKLAKNMLHSGGGLITEMRSGTKISPGLFPARNRIIAAMSDATIVVEASKTGGALITANIAHSYHRDLFAFPGRIGDKYSEGCNAIIAACKAVLLRDSDDIFVNMGWERRSRNEGRQTTLFPTLKGDEKTIYQILQEHPSITVDEMREYCDLSLSKIVTALLNLELKSLCQCLLGKIYKPM
ncbi:MAG: DNA-processing protein DprA [Bacteroidales bacterium]|nr:DNA-processing protein DprA [Bacteroidales bacterium]